MIFNGPHIWDDQNGGQIWPFPAAWRLNEIVPLIEATDKFSYRRACLAYRTVRQRVSALCPIARSVDHRSAVIGLQLGMTGR